MNIYLAIFKNGRKFVSIVTEVTLYMNIGLKNNNLKTFTLFVMILTN